MIVCFTLKIDGWRNGENELFSRMRSFSRKNLETAERVLTKEVCSYRFSDGVVARAHIKKVSPQEARKIEKKSSGFFGYDWMIDSIIQHGKIIKE